MKKEEDIFNLIIKQFELKKKQQWTKQQVLLVCYRL